MLLRLLTIGGDQVALAIGPDGTRRHYPIDATAVYGILGTVEAHSRGQAWELCKADEEIRARLPHLAPGDTAEPVGMWLVPASAIAEFEALPVQGWEVKGL